MFFKIGVLKNFAIMWKSYNKSLLLKRDSNAGVFKNKLLFLQKISGSNCFWSRNEQMSLYNWNFTKVRTISQVLAIGFYEILESSYLHRIPPSDYLYTASSPSWFVGERLKFHQMIFSTPCRKIVSFNQKTNLKTLRLQFTGKIVWKHNIVALHCRKSI